VKGHFFHSLSQLSTLNSLFRFFKLNRLQNLKTNGWNFASKSSLWMPPPFIPNRTQTRYKERDYCAAEVDGADRNIAKGEGNEDGSSV